MVKIDEGTTSSNLLEITLNCQLLPREILDIEGYVDETIEYVKSRNTEIIKYEVCGVRFHNMTIDGVEYSSL